MTRYFIYISILICGAALSYGMGAKGFLPASIGAALLGIAWMAAVIREYPLISAFGFPLFVFLCVLGIWLDLSHWLMVTGIAASLAAWDLIHFNERLQFVGESSDRGKMEREHLLQLVIVVGTGILGYIVAMQVHIALTFGGAALLALIGIWGVSALVYRLRSRE